MIEPKKRIDFAAMSRLEKGCMNNFETTRVLAAMTMSDGRERTSSDVARDAGISQADAEYAVRWLFANGLLTKERVSEVCVYQAKESCKRFSEAFTSFAEERLSRGSKWHRWAGLRKSP